MKISLTGTITIEVDGTEATAAGLGPLVRLALAYLVLERHRPVPRDELAQALWDENLPPTWRAALRGVMSRLRAFLDASGLEAAKVVTADQGRFRLCLPPDAVVDLDSAVGAFDDARAALDAGDAVHARRSARAASVVCRRQFLAGSTGAWVELRQAELRELQVQSLEVLSQAAGACGDHAGALRTAQEAVGLQPLRESAHLRVIEAHTGAGNRGEALRAYERCRQILAEELGVRPSPRTETSYISLLGEEPQSSTRSIERAQASNLPATLTSYVGRKERIDQAKALLSSTRMLTLTGIGGSGKSRLAIEVASDVVSDYPGSAWLVELAGLADPALVPQQALSALGLTESPDRHPVDSLVRHLTDRPMLLVLDNCEHLASSCAALADTLLRAAPGLRILATSRQPLRVAGETTWTVPLLSIPGRDDPGPLVDLLGCEAVRLFVDRVSEAAPGLDLELVTSAVVAICRRLDGVPLAIELAAARARVLSVPEISRRLDDRFRLLLGGVRTAPSRHQTLRATFAWSYEMLSSSERRLFARLSVFAGGFTLSAAERVCSGLGLDVLNALSSLVDKSLVLAERSGGEVRYRLLETVREYAGERLRAIGEEAAVGAAHLRWAVLLAGSAEPGLESQDQGGWLDVLDFEHDNLRAALDWADFSGALNDGLCLAASLWRFWEIRGHLSEGRSRLEMLLARSEEVAPPLRAKALNSAGVLAQRQSDRRAARRFFEDCLALRRSLDDRLGIASALHGLGTLAVGEGDLATAGALFSENLRIGRELGERRMVAASLMNLGVVMQFLAHTGQVDLPEATERAQARHQESLALYCELGDLHGVALSLESLALVPPQGDHEASRCLLQESLTIRRELGDKVGIAASVRFLGHLALRNGDYDTARDLHQECLIIERELGNQVQVAADLAHLAEILGHEGDGARARCLLEESLALYRDMEDSAASERVLGLLQASTP
ncbi:MAG: BTAD domain-containing putative transcriptional regulator [Acidimicrobiales bacterium]